MMYFFTSFPRLDLSEGREGSHTLSSESRVYCVKKKKKKKNPAPPQIDTHLCPTLISSYNHF